MVGLFTFFAAFFFLFLVKEPHKFDHSRLVDKTEHFKKQDEAWNALSLSGKVMFLTSQVIESCRRSSIIPLAYFITFCTRLNNTMSTTFLTLWTTSFIGTEGVKTQQDA